MARTTKASRKSANTTAVRKRASKRAKTSAKKTPRRATKPARAAAPAPNPARRALQLFTFAHDSTTALLADWPEDKLTFQPSPTDNHALWTIGHLAATYQWFATLLDGTRAPLPDNYYTLFGTGSKPVADPAAYPPAAEVRAHFNRAYQRFVDLAARIRPADAAKPTIGDSHGFCRDRADVLDKAAWHEGWHAGQLSSLRRALGLKGII
jgi:hypothetical protein